MIPIAGQNGIKENRENWGSQWGFILATVGSAVGLGNVWRFPTVVAENGGGTFVLIYLAVVFLIGIPMMIAELTLGRAGRRNVIGMFRRLVPRTGWWLAGLFPLTASFVILSFYSVVAGWTLLYIAGSLSGTTAGLDAGDLTALFNRLTANPVYALAGQGLFLLVTASIVIVGIRKGIERWSRVLMPGILLLLLALFLRAVFFEGYWSGVVWFLSPRAGAFTFGTALEAVGQVFFSFSLGMGAILTYGSYLPRHSNIPLNSLYISMADLGVALLTGLIVIPSLFVFGFDPETGPGLIFSALPAVFNTLPLSMLWSTLFFLLLSFAALTSAVSLLEVVTAYLAEELGWSRFSAVTAAAAGIFALGVPAALSRGLLSNVFIGGFDIFDFLDYTASNLLLPLGGLLMVLFAGWIWGTGRAAAEINQAGHRFEMVRAWSILIRFVVPLGIAYILFNGLRPS